MLLHNLPFHPTAHSHLLPQPVCGHGASWIRESNDGWGGEEIHVSPHFFPMWISFLKEFTLPSVQAARLVQCEVQKQLWHLNWQKWPKYNDGTSSLGCGKYYAHPEGKQHGLRELLISLAFNTVKSCLRSWEASRISFRYGFGFK